MRITGETVEKVPKQILGWDAEKNDLTECATINDLIIMRGHETPENHLLTILKGFSTVSEERVKIGAASSTYKFWRSTYVKGWKSPEGRRWKLTLLMTNQNWIRGQFFNRYIFQEGLWTNREHFDHRSADPAISFTPGSPICNPRPAYSYMVYQRWGIAPIDLFPNIRRSIRIE